MDVCKLDFENKYCLACKRTLQEIKDWSQYTDKEKQEVLNQIMGR